MVDFEELLKKPPMSEEDRQKLWDDWYNGLFIIKIIIAILIIVIGGITFSVVMSYEPPVESHSIRLSNYSEWSAWNVINMSCEILVRYDNESQDGGMARCYKIYDDCCGPMGGGGCVGDNCIRDGESK